MIPIALFNPLSILLSLSTLFGVVIHDTKVDQFTTVLLSAPAVMASYEGFHSMLSKTDHTHSERVSISELGRSLAYQNPRTQVRNDDKKHVLQKNVMRGHHPFDNYNLPVIS